MADFNRVKTWVTGEKLFAADLNAEFDAVKSSLNGIDNSQLNANAVAAAQLQTASVETAKIDDLAVATGKMAAGSVSDTHQWNITGRNSTTPFVTLTWTASNDADAVMVSPVIVTPANADDRCLVQFDAWLGLASTFSDLGISVALEVDRVNSGAGPWTEVAGYGATSYSGVDPNRIGGGGEYMVGLHMHYLDDEDLFTPGVPAYYRIRLYGHRGGTSWSGSIAVSGRVWNFSAILLKR